jgi:Xaa-Pro aminopeptidase
MQADKLKIIEDLRKQFEKYKINGFIITSHDEFLNEYVPPQSRRLEYVTGFTGSNGVAIIGESTAALYTDGRYTLQAKQELPSDFSLIDINDSGSRAWFESAFKAGDILGYDPMLLSKKDLEYYEHTASQYGFTLKPTANLVDEIWQQRPMASKQAAFALEIKYCGKSREDKIKEITALMKADYLLLCNPDAICWLLNMRGFDIPYTPFLLSYLLLSKEGEINLFATPEQVADLALPARPWEEVRSFIPELLNKGKSLQLDPHKTPVWFCQLPGDIVFANDPCELPKAIKNPTEIAGIRKCHISDGKAVSKFIQWVKEHYQKGLDEMKAADKLLEFRQKSKNFVCPSFATISAFGSNGAIIHYQANKATNKTIDDSNLYLIDSGGQYYTGTTDITRTIALGQPTQEQRENYTLVLKGHIAIATARFPIGTTGAQLDSLARQFLWQKGKDYAHGTGHGVGHFLSVHEGPQRISKMSSVALAEGMVLSNEPGYYKPGAYGIRLENLILVTKSTHEGFLEFDTLTLVPFDDALIDFSLLNANEKAWLERYHQHCRLTVGD